MAAGPIQHSVADDTALSYTMTISYAVCLLFFFLVFTPKNNNNATRFTSRQNNRKLIEFPFGDKTEIDRENGAVYHSTRHLQHFKEGIIREKSKIFTRQNFRPPPSTHRLLKFIKSYSIRRIARNYLSIRSCEVRLNISNTSTKNGIIKRIHSRSVLIAK